VLDGEKAIGGYLAGFNAELAGGLVKEKPGAPDVTGCARAHGEDILTGWFQSKSFVKGSHPVDFHYRYSETLGHGLHGLFGNITVVFLNVLEHFNELIRLTQTSFQNLSERLGRHINLLWSLLDYFKNN
jgi:hypothetical protein